MDKNDHYEFVMNPSKSTQYIVEIVLGMNQKYDKLFKTKNLLKKLKRDINIQMYLKQGYLDYYNFLQNYSLNLPNSKGSKLFLEFLIKEFKVLYRNIMFNNISLSYTYARNVHA